MIRSAFAARIALSSLRTSLATRNASSQVYHGTTILSVRKGNKVVLIGDGQVSLGETVVKANAKKVRMIGKDVMAGFAGATADAMSLIERLEGRLDEHPGQLMRSCVELAKLWRTDKYLRRLEATMIVADAQVSLTITGNGDVLEPTDGVIGIGSGGMYAVAAAKAMMDRTDIDAEEIARRAMQIAADICIFTNSNFVVETITLPEPSTTPLTEPPPSTPPSS
mmetsp:Transcript_22272/g.36879  ORF Transcript_22272/g.36879 Transcript_22272/m.36879 type:complete len:223 (+) Transcript_22272:82-750(+)